MAEAVLYNIADGIIAKLGSVVLQEIGLWWGVKEELEKLKGTVSIIKAVLLHAEEQSMQSPEVKLWLGMLKEAIYDADDLLDDFSTEALRQQVMTGNRMTKEVRRFFSSSNQLSYGLKMAHKITAIRERLDEIAANRKFFLEERSRETLRGTYRSREQTHSSAPEVVVGRDDDKEAIIELLLSSNKEENVSTVPIVGIGGLGKTTLAQLVYNHEKVKMHFELRAWACISDNFDVKLTVEKIIESVSREKHGKSEMDPLKSLLHEKINGKKFLIVLDDLWSDDSQKWFRLKDLLAGGARGSKVVITTRLRRVAEMTRPISSYELGGLPEIESWSLFKQIAFKRGQLPSPSHEAIGKEIVAKCLGVPLAIKTIGGLLYFKDAESDWLDFKTKELSKVDQSENDILPTLKLSYDHLPSNSKHCFAYCSLFPKDSEIDVENLIQCWTAQGYIKSSDENYNLEDIGAEYFMDLLLRSFFQEVERDQHGNIETCKMHDLMHDLAMLVAGEDCAVSNSDKAYSIGEKTRHIFVESDGNSDLQYFPSLLKADKLRTLFLQDEDIKEEEMHAIFCKLRCLRVLDLFDLIIEAVPRSICKLKHLRYLNLSGNISIKTLPDSITELQNLQVLNLEGCYELKHLPKDIKKLVNLCHLNNKNCDELTHMPRGIGQLTRLQKLCIFVVAKDCSVFRDSAGLGELHALNNLRGELTIKNLGYVKNAAFESKAANLKEKRHLQKLALIWNSNGDHYGANVIDNDELAFEALCPHQNLKELTLYGYRGVKSPSWLSSLTNLVSIDFHNCENIQCLPPFDKLPFLKEFSICYLTNLEHIDARGVIFSDGGSASFFPSLTDLQFSGCPNLKGFVKSKTDVGMTAVELPCFQCLSKLSIIDCPNLTFMPLFPSLQELHLGNDGFKSLENVLISASQSSSSSSTSTYSSLSQLKSLKIYDTEENFPEELMQNLTSLQSLKYLFSPVRTLVGEDKDDGMHWQSLKSLRELSFEYMPNLVSLPLGLRHVTALRCLDIYHCPNLMSLPEGMGNLSSLENLYIKECPKLSERCNNNMAEDWPKIAHIPFISIDYEIIQKNGRYQL